MPSRPLLIPFAALIVGALAADCSMVFGTWPIAVALLLAALASFLLSRPRVGLVLMSLAAAVAANFLVADRLAPPSQLFPLPQHTVVRPLVMTGVVVQRPEATRGGGSRLIVRLDDNKNPAAGPDKPLLLQVTIGTGMPAVLTGDHVRFSGRVKVPRLLGLPGEFDRGRYLAWRGSAATTFVARSEDIELLPSGPAYPLLRRFDQLATRMGSVIDQNVASPTSGILKALLLGLRGEVPPDLELLYGLTGVTHILSVSGFHVGILAVTLLGIATWLARRSATLLLWVNVRRWSVLLLLPVITGYLFLTGMAAATVRSVVMLAVVSVALIDEREHDPVDVLLLAAVLMLATAPWLLFDLSCQLSFLAIWGVIVLTPRWVAVLPDNAPPLLRWSSTLLLATVAAILATAPVTAYHFHLFSMTGIVANLFVVPLMGYGAVVIGFAGLLLALLSPAAAGWLLTAAGWLVDVANRGVELCAAVPVWRGVGISGGEAFLLMATVAALAIQWPRWRLGLVVALLTCLTTARLLSWQGLQGKLQVTFLSVGQGESTLIRLPTGKTMLVDTGGAPVRADQQWGERVLLPALWRLGIDRLDYLVITHPHGDHAGGAASLCTALPVGELWYGAAGSDPAWEPLLAMATRHGIPCRRISGQTPTLLLGQVRIEPLWPLPRGAGGDSNDRLLVFRLAWHDFSMLFTGDIGWEVADHLARTHGRQLACSILKIPHHGSRHSDTPTLYQAAAPGLALISAGFGNSFGLPSVDTLSSLHGAGIPLLRTDLDGTIQLTVADSRQGMRMQRHFGHFD